MNKSIENEVRGPLDKKKFLRLKKFLSTQGKRTGCKERVLIDYSESINGKNIADRTIDLRLRSTNGVPEIILKRGIWGASDSRNELSIFTTKGSFDKLVEFFGAIGLTKGVLCERNITTFEYKNIEFSLIDISDKYFTYEAEILSRNQEDRVKIQTKVKKVCRELRLKIFTDEEFFDFIKMLNRTVNRKFDFSNYTEGYFKKNYKI